MLSIIRKVKSQLKKGSTLRAALQEVNLSYRGWQSICAEAGIKVVVPRGRVARVYTLERTREVKKRIRNGEFLRDITRDMGMDPKNLARFCRNNGIILFSKAALQENYKRRANGGRRKGPPSESVVKIKTLIAKEGLKDAEIARRLGVTRQYINYLRHKE
ncbi:MAG: hypothetical protein GY784_03790 [Gammaproteobacteria bacterium]|nr:hypothetical protein [Gammaproteobacteria bacterium]